MTVKTSFCKFYENNPVLILDYMQSTICNVLKDVTYHGTFLKDPIVTTLGKDGQGYNLSLAKTPAPVPSLTP